LLQYCHRYIPITAKDIHLLGDNFDLNTLNVFFCELYVFDYLGKAAARTQLTIYFYLFHFLLAIQSYISSFVA